MHKLSITLNWTKAIYNYASNLLTLSTSDNPDIISATVPRTQNRRAIMSLISRSIRIFFWFRWNTLPTSHEVIEISLRCKKMSSEHFTQKWVRIRSWRVFKHLSPSCIIKIWVNFQRFLEATEGDSPKGLQQFLHFVK